MPSAMAKKGKTKRGRPRKEDTALLAPSTERMRKHRRKKAIQEMLQAPMRSVFCDACLPAALCPSPPCKRGRPLLPSESLTPRGAETRRYRARRCINLFIISLAAAQMDAALAEAEATNANAELAEPEEAETARVEATRLRVARHLLLLAEHNPEGIHGLKQTMRDRQTMQLDVKRGDCISCFEETSSFTPCCGVTANPEWPPMWFCEDCLKRQQLVHARDPVTSNQGRQYHSGHLGHACPHCRKVGVFSNGVRALWRAI
jgi:hypothetical protein